MCSMYSSRKVFRVEITGRGADLPRPHRAMVLTMVASSSSLSRSSSSPLPATIFSRISSIRLVPSRQGTHLPQDSRWVKDMKNRATSTMQVCSSITTMPPEPTMALNFFTESKSRGSSKCFSVRQPPEGPPIWTALKVEPFFRPPPMSKIISRSVEPIGTSIRPVFSMAPVREKVLVPGLPAVPMERYQSAPWRMILGTLA